MEYLKCKFINFNGPSFIYDLTDIMMSRFQNYNDTQLRQYQLSQRYAK